MDGHPHILPRPPFGALVVESGGRGAGTAFTAQSRQGVKMNTHPLSVTQAGPGRVLVGKDMDPQSDLGGTFTGGAGPGGHSRVTSPSRWTRGGGRALIERLLIAPRAVPIYRKEIANLEGLARERAGLPPL